MLLLWKIQCLDSHDRQFKDRSLWLETDTLELAAREAVELCHQLCDSSDQRRWLKFRHLFRIEDTASEDLKARSERHTRTSTVVIHDYFEDEQGQEITRKQMAEILTGSATAVLVPAGARQHDIDFMLAVKRPIQLDQLSVSVDDLKILGIFARDLREILESSFFKNGPGTLESTGNRDPTLQTSASDEEIRSFVTIFRRLYMKNEPANFLKTVEVFARVTQGFPTGNWVAGVGGEYERELNQPPSWVPCIGQGNFSFNRKRLIDVYIYTQYAHQPSDVRTRQYKDCLAAVGGRRGLLTWLFLSTMWECSLHMRNAGVVIANFFDRYRQVHGVSADILNSVARDHPGIGQLEKNEDREQRLFEQAASSLAQQMWESRGKPPGGPASFMSHARRELASAFGVDRNR